MIIFSDLPEGANGAEAAGQDEPVRDQVRAKITAFFSPSYGLCISLVFRFSASNPV